MWHVQPLICNRRINKGVMQTASRQLIGKQVPGATNTNTIIELFWKRRFLLGPCKLVIRKTNGATQLVESCQLLRVEFCTGGCEDRI
jgi:hypothetical protein